MAKKILLGVFGLLSVAAVAVVVLFLRADTEHRPLDDAARESAPGSFIELSDGTTHYELGGPPAGPVVVLVHGFSVPYYIWNTTFRYLADNGFSVLRYDLYGRGYSDRPDVAYDGELFERQLLDLLDGLSLDTPVDLVGLSMGGAVVMRVAANQPGLVRRIVLVDPLHATYPKPAYPLPIGAYVMAITTIPGLPEGQYEDFVHPENYPEWADRYRVQMQFEGFRRAIVRTVYQFLPEDHFANYKAVGALDIPVKLIWGVEDRTLDISGANTVRQALEVEYMPVAAAGHLPHIEQAATVNPAIAEFLSAGETR